MKICKNCNNEYQDNMKFCPECGFKLEVKPYVCLNCGTEYKEGQKFCSECGAKLISATSVIHKGPMEKEIQTLYEEGCTCSEKGHEKWGNEWNTTNTANDLNYKKAIEFFERAASYGHYKAMDKLSEYYGCGWGVMRDDEIAEKWNKKCIESASLCAKNGDIDAMFILGKCYDVDSFESTYDPNKAEEWFVKAVNAGSIEAALELANHYYIEGGINKVIDCYKKAAYAGSDEAMLELAKCNFIGYGVSQSSKNAIEWILQAANLGSLVGLAVLGDCYENGKGLDVDRQKAIELYSKIHDANPKVMEDVGLFYAYGFENGGEDIEIYAAQKAIEWYKRSFEAGLTRCYDYICSCYCSLESIYLKSNNYQELLKLYDDPTALKFAQFSNLPSKKGDCYIGMKMFLQAENYYKQGILAGDCMAYKRLGDINFWGFINPQNYKKAYEYYTKYIEFNKSDDDFRKWLEKYYDRNGRIIKEKILSDCHESDFEELISHRPWDSMDKQRMTYRKVDENRLKGIESTTSQTVKDSLTTGTNDVSKKDEYHDQGNSAVSTSLNSAIDKCIPNVFFIKAVGFDVTYLDGKRQQINCSNKGEIPSWTGTGFLLADGRFLTARHVVEAWSFPAGSGELDDSMVALNIVANNGGKVVAKFVAISSNGTQIHFTSDQCTINHRSDKVRLTEKGAKLVVADIDDTDYAYFYAGRTSGLPHNNAASTTLARGTKLVVLGFPLGIGANSANDINPILGSGIVAAPGLQKGVILTTDTNYEQGNSGGPVFITNSNGELEVIGLVSAGAGRTMGFIVPIAAVK